ncbi:MAG: MFS transporter [Ktedonobacteraceae bacterium]
MADMTPFDPAIAVAIEKLETTGTKKQWWYLLGLALSVMVGGLSSVCIKQLLLPIQTSQLAPHDTNTAFTLVASIGALAGLLASPLVGALSDRTSLRSGRRRPWLVGGIASAVLGMSIMAFASSIPVLLLGEIFAQIGVDTVLAITTAVIPDQIPLSQRPFISACVGMAPNVGGVIGLLLVARLTDTRIIAQGYLLVAAVSLCCVLAFLLILREPPVAPEELPPPFHLGSFLVSFVQPLRAKDFRLTFASRCCAYLSFTILGAYTLFYLRGVLHEALPLAAMHVANFQLLSTAVLIVFAFVAGWFSKRTGQIKLFVISGACGMALGLVVIVAIPTWTALLVAAVLFGAGFGLFLGVDIALAIRVLPSEQARAKDLGLMYNAIYLPLILSPLIGAGVLNTFHNNFALLFAIAALASVLSAVLIAPITSVR